MESLGRSRVDPVECLFEHPGQHQQIGAAVALRLFPFVAVLVGFFVRHVVADARFDLVSPDSDTDATMTDFVDGFVGFSSSFVVFHFLTFRILPGLAGRFVLHWWIENKRPAGRKKSGGSVRVEGGGASAIK